MYVRFTFGYNISLSWGVGGYWRLWSLLIIGGESNGRGWSLVIIDRGSNSVYDVANHAPGTDGVTEDAARLRPTVEVSRR